MKFIKSKSNFLFGIIFVSVIVIIELPIVMKFITMRTQINPISLCLMIFPLIISVVMFLQGMEKVIIDDKSFSLNIFFFNLKKIPFEDVKETGIGKYKINKKKYYNQLYVSSKLLSDKQTEDMSKIGFSEPVIYFDFDSKAYALITEKLNLFTEDNKQ